MKNAGFILTLLLMIFLCSCSTARGDTASDAQKIAARLVRSGNIKNLCPAADDRTQKIYSMDENEILSLLYGMRKGDVDEVCVYLPENAMSVDEVAVFYCDGDDQLNKAKLAVNYRISELMALYRSVPILYSRIADARCGQNGRFYYLIIASSGKADAAESFFQSVN